MKTNLTQEILPTLNGNVKMAVAIVSGQKETNSKIIATHCMKINDNSTILLQIQLSYTGMMSKKHLVV